MSIIVNGEPKRGLIDSRCTTMTIAESSCRRVALITTVGGGRVKCSEKDVQLEIAERTVYQKCFETKLYDAIKENV